MRTHGAIPANEIRSMRWYDTGAVNLNQEDTDVATFTGFPSSYLPVRLIAFAKTGSVSSKAVELNSQSGGGGTAVADQVTLSSLTAAEHFQIIPITEPHVRTDATLWLHANLVTGGAGTARFVLEVLDLS